MSREIDTQTNPFNNFGIFNLQKKKNHLILKLIIMKNNNQ